MKSVTVYVDNRTARLVGSYPSEKLLAYWSYSVPGYRFMQSKFPGWDGRIKMLKRDQLSAGLFWATYKEIEKDLHIRFKIRTDISHPKWRLKGAIRSDRDYQNACVSDVMTAINSYGGCLVLNATGTGKTYIAAMLASRVKCTVCFVVDQLDLLEQAKEEIESVLSEKVGYVGNSKFKPRRVTVATVQTLARHKKKSHFREWEERWRQGIQIIDEIHVQMSRRNFSVVENIKPQAVVGLTATLELSKKPVRLRAWALTGPVAYEYPLEKGMKAGFLAKGVAVRVLYPNSRGSSDYSTGAPSAAYGDAITENAERNSIVSRLTRYAWKKEKHIIVLVERLAHMDALSRRLHDVPHKLVAGTVKGAHMKVAKRRKVQKQFEKGKVRTIIANKVFKKGVDIKRVDIIVDAAALKSKNDAIQKFGRGIRTHADKTGLMYFDIADQDPRAERIKLANKAIELKNKKRKRRGKKPLRKLKLHSYHRAASSRYKAYKKAGITVMNIPWDDDAKAVFVAAEKLLAKELSKNAKHSSSKKES